MFTPVATHMQHNLPASAGLFEPVKLTAELHLHAPIGGLVLLRVTGWMDKRVGKEACTNPTLPRHTTKVCTVFGGTVHILKQGLAVLMDI